MKIENTTDYEKFQTILGNRNISQRKVKKIVSDVEKGLDLFRYCPVIVTENDGKLNIVDGQHRFTASKQLELPIYYVVAKDIELRDIARMNCNTDKWKYSDFTEWYIKLGIKDYQVLKTFCKQYRVNLRMALGMLMQGTPSDSNANAERFMDGQFKVNHYEYAVALIKLVDRLFGLYSFSRHNYLIQAVDKLQKKGLWDIDVMEAKIKNHRHMMDKQSSVKTYIYLLEQIYNMRTQNRKTIF